MNDQIIKLNGVYKKYPPDLLALDDINLTISHGEFVAFMGSSGSGKSTLMHIIGCLDIPSSGNYWFMGEEIGKLKDNKLAEIRNQKIGFVFQSFHLIPRLNALRNVEMPLFYGSMARQERKERARILLKDVGLENRLTHVPAKLSGGEKQRVAIARAIANQPDLIIADEPTGNLDSHTGKEIMKIFCRLHEQGSTVIIITHDSSIASYADRIIRLMDGRIMEGE